MLPNATQLYEKNKRANPQKFRYTLNNPSKGPLKLEEATVPDGWRDGEVTFIRDEIYHGVLRGFSTNELLFVKEARDYLVSVYENEGVNGNCVIEIDLYDGKDEEWKQYFYGKIDFTTYRVEEIGVSVQVTDQSFTEIVRNRDQVDYNLYDLEANDGQQIVPFPNMENLKLKITKYGLTNEAVWSLGDTNTIIDTRALVAIALEYSAIQNCVTPNLTGTDVRLIENAFIRDLATGARINFRFWGFVYRDPVQTGNWSFNITLRQYKSDGTFNTISLFTSTTTANSFIEANISIDQDIEEDQGPNSYVLYIDCSQDIQNVQYNEVSVNFGSLYEEIERFGLPMHEVFTRLIQKSTGIQDPFRSTKFGQGDSETGDYTSNGELVGMTNSLMIRKDDNSFEKDIQANLRDTFLTMSGIFNLGLGIENGKVVVENRSYFYSPVVILDLSDRVREAEIAKEVIPEMHYNNVRTGFRKSETKVQNGLREFNATTEYVTVLSSLKNTLDVTAPYRADTFGVIENRKEQTSKDKADSNKDYDNFVFDMYKILDYDYRTRTTEGINVVAGNINQEESYNVRFSPARSAVRHGEIIKAGLLRNLGSKLRFSLSKGKSGLASLAYDDFDQVNAIGEANTLLYQNMPDAYFYAEKYIIEVPFRQSDLNAITEDSKGLIKLSDTKFGWILNIQTSSVENKASIELLRCNTDVVRVIQNNLDGLILIDGFGQPGTGDGLSVQINDGTPPFTYEWQNGSQAPTIGGLESGTETYCDVFDNEGKSSRLKGTYIMEIEILENPIGLSINEISGYVGSVTYLWSTGQTFKAIKGLVVGRLYTCTVTDSKGNSATTSKVFEGS